MKEAEQCAARCFANDTLREMMKNSEDYLFIIDRNLRYERVSETVAKLTGYETAEQLVGKTDEELFPQKLAESYRADNRKVIESGEPILGKIEPLPIRGAAPRWGKTWKYAIRDDEGQIIGLYGICHDITSSIEAEARAKAAENYSKLIDNIPGGVAILHESDGVFYLDFANDGCFEMQHNTRESWNGYMGAQIMEAVYPPDKHFIAEEYSRIKGFPQETGSVDYRVVGIDGQLHWVNIRFRAAYEENGTTYYYATYYDLDQQKQAEEILSASRNALKEMMENSDIQFFTYYPDAARCEINTVSRHLSELPTVWENFPEDFLEYVKCNEEDAQAVRAAIGAINGGAEEAECLIRFAYRAALYWEKMRLKAVRDAGGNLIRVQGYSINVTSRKNAEERIRRERVRLKTLEGGIFEAFTFNLTKGAFPDIQTEDTSMLEVKITDEMLREALSVCPQMQESCPTTRELFLRVAARIPNAEERRKFIAACSAAAMKKIVSEGKHSTQICYRRYIGKEIKWVSTTVEVLPEPENGDLIAFYYTKDIQDEVIRKEIYSRIIDMNYEAVAYVSLQTKKLYLQATKNKEDLVFHAMPYEDALKEVIAELVPPEKQEQLCRQLNLETVTQKLEHAPVETIYYNRHDRSGKMGAHQLCRMKSDIFYLDENRDTLVLLFTDVTEIFEQERESRTKLEAALAAAEQASVAKTEFLSRMSHEIRTPMNAIIGLDAIALQEKDISDSMVDHLQKIGISARFLLSLINDILDMSRIESGRLVLRNEPFHFEEMVDGINTILYEQCRNSGIDYECVLKSYTEESYLGDAPKLQQVLINLLGNAVKFTPSGGKIHFMIEQISSTREKARLRFEISDTGIGIDEKFIGHLFEPFAQENRGRTSVYGGTGLGLAISKNIVHLMNGDITVHSIKNIGSEFTVEVELGLTGDAIRRRQMGQMLRPLSTLIVDDDIIVCQHTQLILKEAGLKTEYVESGAGAIEKVEERHRIRQDYDLILLDWQMPDMDGIATAREIRKIVGPDVTIIIMTAYDWADIEKKALAAGVDLFMKKPIFASSVTRAFENVFLNKSEAAAPQEPQYDFVGKTVLLAEDNTINAEIARNLLEMKSCAVELVSNGAEAVEAFAAAAVGHFDAILMDVRMPVMDGLEATRAIRAMRKADAKKVPILAMTANAFQEDVNQSMDAGMNAHLAKPIEPKLLYETLKRHLMKNEKNMPQ